MANKALTIDVNTAAIPNGKLNKWDQLGNTTVFINNIQTPQLSADTNVGQLVSGIPSAFARVDLFKKALDYVASDTTVVDNDIRNLLTYYHKLVKEWRGLIACMALDYAHINVRQIELAYSDGKDISTTSNVYEPKGAFGNMLMDRSIVWCRQDLTNNENAVPFINVIKYHGKVVAATSPETLLFTSTGYSFSNMDLPWIDINTGKFIDPIESEMTHEQLANLYAYVIKMIDSLEKVQSYYSKLPEGLELNYNSIRRELEKWRDEISQKAKVTGVELSSGCIPPVNAAFSEPFNKLFCHKDILYGLEGIITITPEAPGAVEFDPESLLLDDSAKIANIRLDEKDESFSRLPILVLTAEIKNSKEKAYFALPLSALGLNVFGKNVTALVGMSSGLTAINSTLKAIYDPAARVGNLEVVLTIRTSSGVQRSFKKVYTSDSHIKNKDVLIWPNFISPYWDKYYMYSELPHNGTSHEYRSFPFVGEMQGDYFRIMVDDNQKPVLLSQKGTIVAPSNRVNADLLVRSDDAVADNPYKYEIYSSNRPFKGVRLLSPTGNEGGYILINYSASRDRGLPLDLMLDRPTFQEVRLGVDFGSTNTSIAYSNDSIQECGFEFETQRVSLMGNELPGSRNLPRENQIFFFQSNGPKVRSNSIKSVLTLHDPRRLPMLKTGELPKMRDEKEIIGGFPCFAENLPFVNSTDKTITLRFPNSVGEVTQIHNMKWDDGEDDKAHKSAFLRTLMLQVYANLFLKNLVPTSLKWSYPSAMMGHLLISYQNIWDSVKTVVPVLKNTLDRYSLDISRYQDNNTFGIDFNNGRFGEEKTNETDAFSMGFEGGFDSNLNGFGSGGFGGGFGSEDFGQDDFSGFGGSLGETTETMTKTSEENVSDLKPDDPNRTVEYKPVALNDASVKNPSFSEAEAVANYISTRYSTEANVLNLCFDIGGSTTDISALFLLKDSKSHNRVTMIKQNSIRFAAQRVSQSVRNFPKFQKVLSEICSKFGIRMVGLNMGSSSYSPNTAPYFFDQIINRLSEEQLPVLYQHIASDCKELMNVNLYVTGLLMYYAGEIANKLIDDLNHTTPEEWSDVKNPKIKPNVRVTFAGKGSRLFQWLNSFNSIAAKQYYGSMFVLGYGEKELKNSLQTWQQIALPQVDDSKIKYEVSMGLAKGDSELQRPSAEQPTEIIGESGFEVVSNDNSSHPVEFTNSMTPEMMRTIGIRFRHGNVQNKSVKFTEFLSLYYQFAHRLFGWNANPQELSKACQNLNIVGYAQNMEEFRTAKREAQEAHQPFTFVAPIIILEGMKFYDEKLIGLL